MSNLPDPDFYRAKHEAEGAQPSWAWLNPPVNELARREHELQRKHQTGQQLQQAQEEGAASE